MRKSLTSTAVRPSARLTVRQARGASRVFVAGALATSIALALYGTAGALPANAAAPQANQVTPAVGIAGDALPGSFSSLVKSVRPAVVHVDTTATRRNTALQGLPPGVEVPEQLRRFFDSRKPGQGAPAHGVGSGFVVDSSGYIVTNNHVIDSADHIMVTLHDGTELEAELVGTDPKTDLALLRVTPATPLTAVRFGDSDHSEVGDWVVAMGSPFGLGGSVTAGIISARGRDINSGPYDDFLQIDAPINRGNSGGPLFNRKGEVVGVNTAIFSPSGGNIGIGFAIPANQAGPVIDDLKVDGRVERGYLGVNIQSMDEALAASMGLEDKRGALVASVADDSPAGRGGVQVGDVVLALDGAVIDGPKALSRVVAGKSKGDKVELGIWRDGKQRSLQVALGALESEQTAALDAPATPSKGPRLGLSLAPLNDGQKERYGLSADEQGVLVAAVEPGGPAAEQGIRPGDVILKIGRDTVNSPQQAVDAVREHTKSERVLMLLNRDGNQRFVAVPVGRG